MAWEPDYISTEELAAYLRIGDADDDVELALDISAASRAVDVAAGGRQFGKTDGLETRTYPVRWTQSIAMWIADIDDLMILDGLVVQASTTILTAAQPGSGVTSGQYYLEPFNAAQLGRPYEGMNVGFASIPPIGYGERIISVTAQWGWPKVPDTIKLATRLQAARFAIRRQAPFGVAGSPQMGSELRLLAKADPDVEVAVRRYKRLQAVRF